MPSVFKVSQVIGYIANVIKRETILSNLTIEGEISNFADSGGNLYFQLKDETASLNCVIFRNYQNAEMRHLRNGDRVEATGSITTYAKSSSYQLIIRSVKRSGAGDIYRRYLELKDKLHREGLFDLSIKKELPVFPCRIGIISSLQGAALRDILKVILRRYPMVQIQIHPSLVQGPGAASNLITALDFFEARREVDLIIIGRGGGSFEDLNEFNDEALVRRIHRMSIPIVAAVGHQVDLTLTDLVADLRAATPTEAGELVTRNRDDLVIQLEDLRKKYRTGLRRRLEGEAVQLEYARHELALYNPQMRLLYMEKDLTSSKRQLNLGIMRRLDAAKLQLTLLKSRLEAQDPNQWLQKGYGLVFSKEGTIKSIEDTQVGDQIQIRLLDGQLSCTVDKKEGRHGD